MREDVQRAVKEFHINLFGNRRKVEPAEEYLHDDETVLYAAGTNVDVKNLNGRRVDSLTGIVFLTDKRLLVFQKFFDEEKRVAVWLNDINSFDFKCNGVTASTLNVYTDTNIYSILVTYKKSMVKKILKTFEDASKRYKKELIIQILGYDPAALDYSSKPAPTPARPAPPAPAPAPAAPAASPAPAPVPAEPALSLADEIRKCKDLLDCGAITQEEFDAVKKKLLGL